MELRLLGPLEVVVDGSPLPLGGPKQRTVLAVLAHASPRAVPVHVLLDAVWDDDPGPRAETTLQVYVSNLRRALAATPMRIVGEAGGYRLDTHGVVVDRDVVAAGPEGLVALFRGPAGADLAPGRFAEQVARDVAELHASAAEQDADVRLARGEHAALVPVLQQLCREHPVRERLWGQLVLALYRCDRQAEALAAYAELREHLDEELGLSPSPALQQLHQRVLRQDPTLVVPAVAAVPVPPRTAAPEPMLPAPVSAFVGRADELSALTTLLREQRLVTVHGFGGMGKTRLALEAARAVAGEVWFVDLSAVTDVRRVPEAVAEAVGVELSGEDPVVALSAALRERQGLLLLDNLEQLLPEVTSVVDALLAVTGLRLLVTSREALGLRGEHVLRLGPLVEARDLLLARARAVGAPLDPADPVVDEVVALLHGWPLAVELAAARLPALGAPGLLRRLRDERPLPAGPRDLPARQQSLAATVQWSLDLLDEAPREVLAVLSVFPGGATLASLEAVCGRDVLADVEALLASSLAQAGEDPDGEPRLHLLLPVQQHVRDQLGEGLAALRLRHAEHVRDLVEQRVAYKRSTEKTVALVDVELPNIRAALATFREAARATDVRQLTSALVDCMWHLGRLIEVHDLARDALAVPHPEQLHEAYLVQAEGTSWALCDREPEHARQLITRSVQIAREAGDLHQMAMSLMDLSMFEGVLGDPVNQARHQDEAYEAARASAPGPQRIRTIDREAMLSNLCWVRAETALDVGDTAAAEALTDQGLQIAREAGLGNEELFNLKRRALCRMLQGRHDLALVDLDAQDALTQGLPMMRGEVLSERAWAKLLTGDLDGAERDSLACEALRNDNARSTAVASWVHAEVLRARGDGEGALAVADRALATVTVSRFGWHVLPQLARARALRLLGRAPAARQQLVDTALSAVQPPLRSALAALLLELARCTDEQGLAAGLRGTARQLAAEPGSFVLRLLTEDDGEEAAEPLELDEALRLSLGGA